MNRLDSDFVSGGLRCDGWLYLPDGAGRPPVVVMGHGFAGEKAFGLANYAERFAAAGLAVYVFDYRNFGDSQGEPRNLVHPRRHLEDWAAALSHVRSLDAVDPDRIGLWGSSFSGGHVIVTAARDGRVRAAVAQVPFLDGLDALKTNSPAYIIKAAAAGLWDVIRSALTGHPYYVPVVGDPDEFAVLNSSDAKSGYLSLLPEGSTWENRCPARIFLMISGYRPIKYAHKVKCPVLLLPALKDTLLNVPTVEKAAKLLPFGEIKAVDAGHFEVYGGELFERTVGWETDFLVRHLTA